MNRTSLNAVLLLTLFCVLATGCTKPYKVLTELEQPIPRKATYSVGSIADQLPADFDVADKPTAENIHKLKNYLVEEIDKRELMKQFVGVDMKGQYIVRGAIIDYAKGSGFIRFLFGFGLGAAKITLNLELYDTDAKAVVFSGNFTASVTTEFESGDQVFKKCAKNFCKALEKQMKKLEKAARSSDA